MMPARGTAPARYGRPVLDGYSTFLGPAWDFASAHPFVSAWLALATAWLVYTLSGHDHA